MKWYFRNKVFPTTPIKLLWPLSIVHFTPSRLCNIITRHMLCNTESITRRGITSKDVKSSSSGLWRRGAAMTRPGLHQAALGPVTTVTLTRLHRSRRHREREGWATGDSALGRQWRARLRLLYCLYTEPGPSLGLDSSQAFQATETAARYCGCQLKLRFLARQIPDTECRIDAAECRLLVTEPSSPLASVSVRLWDPGSEIQWLRDSGSDQADQASDIGPRPTLDTGYLQTLSNHRKFSSTLKQWAKANVAWHCASRQLYS